MHAIATLSVAVGAIRWTTLTEHLSPETAARLEEEGVSDPDRRLTELVQEYTAPRGARVARARALSTAFDEQTVAATDDPVRAAVEQRTAMTPASEPTAPAVVVAVAVFVVIVGFASRVI